jgi:hypothetical protein
LNQKIDRIEREKQDMIDNFKLSSSVLLERLKDLEAQSSLMMGGERPQTANVLSKIGKYTIPVVGEFSNCLFFSGRISGKKNRRDPTAARRHRGSNKNQETYSPLAAGRFKDRE